MFTLNVKCDPDKRGLSLPEDQRSVAERLLGQGYELQRRFEIAENTAVLLQQMLAQDSGIEDAIDNTHEAHAFVVLRLQLFRILVVDIGACVLDMAKSAGSVASIIKELTRGTRSLDALKAYYADPNCLVAKIKSGTLTSAEAEFECEHAIKRSVENSLKSLDSQWKGIKSKRTEMLESTAAKRMKWARNKLVAHFEKSTKGIVPLDAPPPCGNENLTWLEPVSFIDFVRPYVYDVFELVTSTSWGEDYIDMNRFYARAFWDRLKNGKTLLKYEPGRESA